MFEYLESAELSDVGMKRKRNEDSVLRVESHAVFCVADGMGGADAGDVASGATVREIGEALKKHLDARSVAFASEKSRIVCDALGHANEWIKARSQERGRGMSGSTVAVLIFDAASPAKAICLHAGDSRVYRFRSGRLEQITRDHSIAEAAGFKDRRNVPKTFRGVVTRAIGIEKNLDIEHTPVDVKSDDLFMLCSDGLSTMLTDKRLRKILRGRGELTMARLAARLVEQANKRGGDDNISVVLVDVGELKPITLGQGMDESLGGGGSGDEEHDTETESETADTAIPESATLEMQTQPPPETKTSTSPAADKDKRGGFFARLMGKG